MALFTKIIHNILRVGTAVGAAFMVAMMLLIVANVIFRLTGGVIAGSFEVSELLIVVAASFALGYAAMHRTHVDVKIVVDYFPRRWQMVVEAGMSFLAMGTWAVIAWTGIIILFDRWDNEESVLLLIPFYPFRAVLFFGMVLITLVYLIFMIESIREAVKK
ncbi:TRAP transporter small permease [Thermodesulfobacteriota bacterium]